MVGSSIRYKGERIWKKRSIAREILEQLRTLKPQLAERYAIDRLGLFGSVAREEARPTSDIDVVVYKTLALLKRVRLKAELENLFGREVDAIRERDSLNPYLKARSDRSAIYVGSIASVSVTTRA